MFPVFSWRRQTIAWVCRDLRQLQRRSHALLAEAISGFSPPGTLPVASSLQQQTHKRNPSSDLAQLQVSSKPMV